jgi:hypothetical protein
MEILTTETFGKIKPTDPLILGKQAGNESDRIPPVCRWLNPMLHGDHARIKDEESHHKYGLTCQLQPG